MALKNTKTFLCCLLSVFVCCFFAGCFPDLGEIENAEDYQKKFSGVDFIKDDLTKNSLLITDLYNDDAVDFNNKDFQCPTDSNAYKYIAVFAGQNVTVQEFVLYLRSEQDAVVNMYVYSAGDLPSVIATGNLSDDQETYTDPDTGDEKTRIKTFDEPNKTDAIAQVTISLKANEWKSFGIKSWKIDDKQLPSFELKKDNCLLFQVANNCVHYNEAGQAEKTDSVKLCFTAMLIRVK